MSLWQPDIYVEPRPQLSPIRPYPHQTAAWDALSRTFQMDGAAGLLVLPTGSGKTFVAAHWLLAHHIRTEGRVLWLAHRRGLLRQAARTFHTLADAAHPRAALHFLTISSSDADWTRVRPEHDVVLSSIQTAGREDRLDYVHAYLRMRPEPVFVVVDEAHHASAPSYYRLLRTLRNAGCPLLGLTATPVRMNDAEEARLHELFDRHVIHQVTRRSLIEEGILAAPVFETVETRIELERDFTEEEKKHLERFGELAPSVLARLATHATRNALIVRQYAENAARYGFTIVFAADVLHARTLAQEFQAAGIDADYVDYTRADAAAVIERYQAKRGPRVLINVEMLTEGFDAPHTRTVMIARPTRSEGLLAQMLGRALRGRRSGGNETAYLVTFVDTWKHFEVLDTEYVLRDDEPEEPTFTPAEQPPLIPIPPELIHEAYRLVMDVVDAELTGVFRCLPHSWYAWEQTYEDDIRRRLVMVFEHQLEGFAELEARYPTPESLVHPVTEEEARELVHDVFGDLPDPLPRWADVQALLEARRQGCEIHHYTFEEKRSFDPQVVAAHIFEQALPPLAWRDHIAEVWEGNAACRSVYRNDRRAFQEEVLRELNELLMPADPPPPPEILRIVPTSTPRPWPLGQAGHSLVRIRDAVVESRKNFPAGAPPHGDLVWSTRPSKTRWGLFRFSDRRIIINCALDSPDVPLYVMEFLMFHELLHAEMPHAGHNADFRARERLFVPSERAVDEALALGVKPGKEPGAWRALATMFLGAFDRKFVLARPGTKLVY